MRVSVRLEKNLMKTKLQIKNFELQFESVAFKSPPSITYQCDVNRFIFDKNRPKRILEFFKL